MNAKTKTNRELEREHTVKLFADIANEYLKAETGSGTHRIGTAMVMACNQVKALPVANDVNGVRDVHYVAADPEAKLTIINPDGSASETKAREIIIKL